MRLLVMSWQLEAVRSVCLRSSAAQLQIPSFHISKTTQQGLTVVVQTK